MCLSNWKKKSALIFQHISQVFNHKVSINSLHDINSAKLVKIHWRDKCIWLGFFVYLFVYFCCMLFVSFSLERDIPTPQHISLMIVTISMERFQRNHKCRTLNCNNYTQRSMELVNDLKYYALNAPILANSGESVDSTCPDQSWSCQCHSRRERYPPFPLLSPLPFF